MTLPFRVGSSWLDCDTSLAFELHEVHFSTNIVLAFDLKFIYILNKITRTTDQLKAVYKSLYNWIGYNGKIFSFKSNSTTYGKYLTKYSVEMGDMTAGLIDYISTTYFVVTYCTLLCQLKLLVRISSRKRVLLVLLFALCHFEYE